MSDAIRKIAERNAPGVVARDDRIAAENAEVEAMMSPQAPAAPAAPGRWRSTGAGTFERDNPQRGGVETITNKDGNVFPDFVPKDYGPPPVRGDRSVAQLLVTEIPKRFETMARYLADGDIDAAGKERARIEEFIDSERPLLHKVARYSGDDRLMRTLSDQALGLATGSWLDEKTAAMFMPAGNPRYRERWARQAGVSPLLARTLRDAEVGNDPDARDRLAGARMALGGFPDEIDPGQATNPRAAAAAREATGVPAITPAALDAYLQYEGGHAGTVAPGAGRLASAPLLGKLFRAGDHDVFRGGLASLVGKVSGGDLAASNFAVARITGEWLPTWLGTADNLDIAHTRHFMNAIQGVEEALGPQGDLMRAGDRVKEALGKVSEAVSVAGAEVSPKDVAKVARIYMTKSMNGRVAEHDAPLAGELARADRALGGLMLSVPADPDLPTVQERVRDPATGTVSTAARPKTAEELYPAFSALKTSMADAMRLARADVISGRFGSVPDALAARAGMLTDHIALPETPAGEEPVGPERVREIASEIMLRGWAEDEDGRFDVRAAYGELYERYGKALDKAELKEKADKLVKSAAGDPVPGKSLPGEVEKRLAAPQPKTVMSDAVSWILGKEYRAIMPAAEGGKTAETSNDGSEDPFRPTGGDRAPGDSQANQIRRYIGGRIRRAYADALAPDSPAMTYVKSRTPAELKALIPTRNASPMEFRELRKLFIDELRAKLDPRFADQVMGADALGELATEVAQRLVKAVSASRGVPELGGTDVALGGVLAPEDWKAAREDALRLGDPPVSPPGTMPPPPGYSEPTLVGIITTQAADRFAKFLTLGDADAKEIPGDRFWTASNYGAAVRANAMALYVSNPLAPPAEQPAEQKIGEPGDEILTDDARARLSADAPSGGAPVTLFNYSVQEAKAAFRAIEYTAEMSTRPVNDVLLRTIINGIPKGDYAVRTIAAQTASKHPGMTVETLRTLIGRASMAEEVRKAGAALAEKATGAFMKAEIDLLMELAKPGDLGAGMGDEEFQTRLRQIAAKYLPQTQE